jgi:hypothetical protein
MYEAIDPFLDVDTWHSTHPEDEARFYRCLQRIIANPDFNADDLGAYIDAKCATFSGDEFWGESRNRYVAAAWAVRRYLQAVEGRR